MASPDVTGYVDLTLFDTDAQTIFEEALAAVAVKFPEWVPREGNTEVALLEALALEASELAYSANRLPGAVTEILLRLFGLTRDGGQSATATVTFTVSDNLGHTIPAGTRLILDRGDGLLPVEFATTTDLTIAPGSTFGTVAVVAIGVPTVDANGTAAGVALSTIDPVPYVNAAVLATPVSSGAPPEDGQAFLNRGIIRLSRLVTTIVRPEQFTAAAVEQVYVARATTVDLFTPNAIATPAAATAVPSAVGGALAGGVYTYRVSAINAQGETLASTSVSATVPATTTGSVALTWTAPAVPGGVGAITGYRIYGRTGTLVRRGTTTGALNFTDTGAAGTGEALPAANTTGPASGTVPGHVTVYAAGPGGVPLSAADKADLLNKLTAAALASLTIYVADPTLNPVAVTATVTILPGYDIPTVLAAVDAALRAYLNPDTWPWAATVYRFELIALISAVEGVDRVATMPTPAADVVLTGRGPLVSAGAFAVTAA